MRRQRPTLLEAATASRRHQARDVRPIGHGAKSSLRTALELLLVRLIAKSASSRGFRESAHLEEATTKRRLAHWLFYIRMRTAFWAASLVVKTSETGNRADRGSRFAHLTESHYLHECGRFRGPAHLDTAAASRRL